MQTINTKVAEQVKPIATNDQIKSWFSKALETAFEKTGIKTSSFSWFSNKPLNK